MARAPLNDQQLEVLAWIRDGAPAESYEDYRPRIVARALHNRNLVEVRGHGPNWSATLTDKGRFYLEHGDYPPAPAETPPTAQRPVPPRTPRQPRKDAPGSTSNEPAAKRAPQPKKVGPTDAMMTALLEAPDHRIAIELDQVQRYRLLAGTAERYKKIPEGMQVTVESDWPTRSAHVTLEPLPEWRTRILDPIMVPETLHSPSDVVKSLKDREDFTIRVAEKRRALRLVQAFVLAARERGYKVAAVRAPRRDRWGYVQRTDDNTGHMKVELGPDECRLSIYQIKDRVEHVATKSELARAGKGWALPQWDYLPTEKLGIRIDLDRYKFWGETWVDREDRSLEEALPQILQELELRHDASEAQRAAEERDRLDRERRWEIARANAVVELTEHHRGEVLLKQVKRWRKAAEIRTYLGELGHHIEQNLEGQARLDALEWAAWIQQYLERIDPLQAALKLPEPPDPTPSALEPFMRGWSPYGPR